MGLSKGAKIELICPAEYAYGDKGHGQIKPGEALIFEIEIKRIETKEELELAELEKEEETDFS